MNKTIAKKLGQIFTISTIIAYFLLLGLLGEEGFFHARSVRGELELLRQRQESLLLQIDSLEQQNKLMSSQDALKDAAFRFGYQVEGEQVYYFTDEGETDHVQQGGDSALHSKRKVFSGFAKPWILLMALAFSSIFTVLWALGIQKRERPR
ncbi:MAG TPA: septum formation initiator family protein [Sphaerochaeta sp.]|nr:septum formation initiator family protein [Sphaerochaeta sp.]